MRYEFYVSDCYTANYRGIPLPSSSGYQLEHYPGVFNQGGQIQGGSAVTVYVNACDVAVTPVGLPEGQGINTDIQLALYDVSSGQAVPKPGAKNVGGGSVLPFDPSFGGAPNGQLCHCVSTNKDNAHCPRDFGDNPVPYTFTLPMQWGKGPWMLGARFQFNFGYPCIILYTYFIRGSVSWTFPAV